jgi:NTP pyrophosphatase (non-canonical NTP hydrolase)
MKILEKKVKEWCDSEFPRDLPGRIRKLGEEFGELSEAMVRGQKKEIIAEAGDCGLVLMDICNLLGASFSASMETNMFIKQALKQREEQVLVKKRKGARQ